MHMYELPMYNFVKVFPKNGLKPIEAKNTRAMAGGTPLQNTGQDPLCLHSEEGTGVELNLIRNPREQLWKLLELASTNISV